MADTKISALTATTTVGDTDEYVVAKAGASRKITGANLKAGVAGDYKPGGTDVAVADGGTGASSASSARTNLGVAIGTDVPALATFNDHSARHEDGGADEISIAGLSGTSTDLAAHLADATDAHDASAVSIVDAGNHFTGVNVEAALQELGAGGGGGGGGGAAVLGNFTASGVTLSPGDEELLLTAALDTESWLDNTGGSSTLMAPPGVYSVTFDWAIDGWKWVSGDTLDLDGATKPILLQIIAGGFSKFGFIFDVDLTYVGIVSGSVTTTVIVESPSVNFLDSIAPFKFNAMALDGVADYIHTLSVTNINITVTRLNDAVTY